MAPRLRKLRGCWARRLPVAPGGAGARISAAPGASGSRQGAPPALSASRVMPSGAELLSRPPQGDASRWTREPAHQLLPAQRAQLLRGARTCGAGVARGAQSAWRLKQLRPAEVTWRLWLWCGSGELGWPPAGRQAEPFISVRARKWRPRAPGRGGRAGPVCLRPPQTCRSPGGRSRSLPEGMEGRRGRRAPGGVGEQSQAERGGNAVLNGSSGQRRRPGGAGCFPPDILSQRLTEFSRKLCVCVC